MKLVLGKNFPSEPPKAFFLTKIFHPNVATNGEICVNTLKKDWKPELGIKHILLVCHLSHTEQFQLISNMISLNLSLIYFFNVTLTVNGSTIICKGLGIVYIYIYINYSCTPPPPPPPHTHTHTNPHAH